MSARTIWLAIGILFALFILGVVGLNFWVRSYLAGDDFRGLVNAQTGKALESKAKFAPFQWTGNSVFSNEFESRGRLGSPLESLTANQIRGEINWRAIFGGTWKIDRIDVARVDATFQFDSQRAEAIPTGDVSPEPDSIRPHLVLAILPRRVELGELRVQDSNVDLAPGYKIRNAPLTVRPEGSGWIFDATGGRLSLPGRDPLDIESVRLRLQKDAVFLTEAKLRTAGAGQITLSGEFVSPPSTANIIFLSWMNIPATEILDAGWVEQLSGTLAGNAEIRIPSPDQVTAEGKFYLSDGQLTGLPMQAEIARFTKSPQFARIPVHQFSGDFVRKDGMTNLTDIVFESKGLVRVEGTCDIGDDSSVLGRFMIGVTPQTLQWLPGSQAKVFTESRDGYLWTDLEVTGTIEEPKENLSSRLAQAVGEEILGSGAEILESVPTETKEAVRDVINSLVPLFR